MNTPISPPAVAGMVQAHHAEDLKAKQNTAEALAQIEIMKLNLPAQIELAKLNAQIARAKFEAYTSVGFTAEQAILLIKGTLLGGN